MTVLARRVLLACVFAVSALAQAPSQPESSTQSPSQAPSSTSSAPAHVVFRVTLAPEATSKTVSGRLLILMTSNPKPVKQLTLGFGNIDAPDVWMGAKEITSLAPGASVDINPDELSYPTSFAKAPAGEYQAQAVLDTNH